jgi:hypothetical protein
MKKLFALFALLAASLASAQNVLDPGWTATSAAGNITTKGTGTDCSVVPACVWIVLAPDYYHPAVQITAAGTWTGTLQFEAAADGKTWSSIATTNGLTSVTANGTYTIQTPATRFFRVRASAWQSGKAQIAIAALSYVPQVQGSGAGNVIPTPLTPNAIVTAASASSLQTPTATATIDPATGNISTPGAVSGTGAWPGADILVANANNLPNGLPAYAGGWIAPESGGTSFLYQPPNTDTAGLMFADGPAITLHGVSVAKVSHMPLVGTDTNIPTADSSLATANAGTAVCTSVLHGLTVTGCAGGTGGGTNIDAFTLAGNQGNPFGLNLTGTYGEGFWLPNPGQFGHLTVWVDAADAGHTAQFGIYSSTGALVASTTAAALSSTGLATLAISQGTVTMAAGKYYFAAVGNAASTASLAEATGTWTFFKFASLSGSAMPSTITVPSDSYVYPPGTGSFDLVWFGLIP